jgi:hypothetical protein
LKKCKSPGSNQNPAELIQAAGERLRSEIHKLINYIWNKEELPQQWQEPIIVPIYKGSKTDHNNYLSMPLLSTSQKGNQYPSPKVKCILRPHYWVSSMWDSTNQISYSELLGFWT